MDLQDVRVSVIKSASPFLSNIENKDRFVIVEHLPSGITVTKHHKHIIKAKILAMEEIRVLVDLWKNEV